MDITYAEPGTRVILCKHKRHTSYGLDWNGSMDIYIGKEAVIHGVFQSGDHCTVCYVDVDNGIYHWRAEDMILASDVPLLNAQQLAELGIES